MRISILKEIMNFFAALSDKRLFREWAHSGRPFPPSVRIMPLIQKERKDEYNKWLKDGKPVPPPHIIKQKIRFIRMKDTFN